MGDHSKQLFRRVTAAVIDDGAPDRGLVPLEERLEKIYFFPFFFAGGFVVFGAAVDAVPVMPSDSERLSSTSTVWVIVSLPFGAGCPSAGAMVCVVG